MTGDVQVAPLFCSSAVTQARQIAQHYNPNTRELSDNVATKLKAAAAHTA
jgi:hypothetical protein